MPRACTALALRAPPGDINAVPDQKTELKLFLGETFENFSEQLVGGLLQGHHQAIQRWRGEG